MKKTIVILIALTVTLLVGCTTSIKQDDIIQPVETKINTGSNIYITKVNNGSFQGKVYTNSGIYVANRLAMYLKKRGAKITLGDLETDYLEQAQAAKADYIIKPVIMNWEPHAAAWSGIPTRCEINISVYDVAQRKEIINRNLTAKGRTATLSSQTVESISDDMLKQFCDAL